MDTGFCTSEYAWITLGHLTNLLMIQRHVVARNLAMRRMRSDTGGRSQDEDLAEVHELSRNTLSEVAEVPIVVTDLLSQTTGNISTNMGRGTFLRHLWLVCGH